MLKHLEEFGKYIAIAGFRNAKIVNVETLLDAAKSKIGLNVEFQFFNAKLVATWQHLYFASLNALTAFKNKTNISKSLAVEIMLYASAQRQIRRAMELIGIKKSVSEITVLVIGEDAGKVNSALAPIAELVGAERDDSVLMLSEDKIRALQKTFEISEAEIEVVMSKDNLEKAIVDVVIERMALLTTQR
ncbi:MAG: KEOPS complex subunit Cgi121 [Candidatus Bathyarchaeia archaeon]